jgi:hydroxypyruvate isomerase
MLWALEKQAPFDRGMVIVGEAGYNDIELVGDFHKWTDERMGSILARMRSLSMIFDSMSGVKPEFAVPEESAAFLLQMQTQIDYAQRLECPQIILLSGKWVSQMDPAVQRQTAGENLKRAGDSCRKEWPGGRHRTIRRSSGHFPHPREATSRRGAAIGVRRLLRDDQFCRTQSMPAIA